jgi:hypothetical protein
MRKRIDITTRFYGRDIVRTHAGKEPGNTSNALAPLADGDPCSQKVLSYFEPGVRRMLFPVGIVSLGQQCLSAPITVRKVEVPA